MDIGFLAVIFLGGLLLQLLLPANEKVYGSIPMLVFWVVWYIRRGERQDQLQKQKQ